MTVEQVLSIAGAPGSGISLPPLAMLCPVREIWASRSTNHLGKSRCLPRTGSKRMRGLRRKSLARRNLVPLSWTARHSQTCPDVWSMKNQAARIARLLTIKWRTAAIPWPDHLQLRKDQKAPLMSLRTPFEARRQKQKIKGVSPRLAPPIGAPYQKNRPSRQNSPSPHPKRPSNTRTGSTRT